MIRTFIVLFFTVLFLIISIPVGLVIMIGDFLLGKNTFSPISKSTTVLVKFFMRYVCFLAGCHITVKGTENIPEDTAVYIGNHQGLFDPVVSIVCLGDLKRIMAKIELKKVPIIHMWMTIIRCIFVDRHNTKKAIESINITKEYVKKGCSVLYYAEGTRSKGPNLGNFKGGAFKCAVETETQIVPFVIDGTYKLFETQNHFKAGDVKFSILPPVKVTAEDNPRDVSDKIKAMIQAELDELRK